DAILRHGARQGSPRGLDSRTRRATVEVAVDEAPRLHARVDGRPAHARPAAALELLREDAGRREASGVEHRLARHPPRKRAHIRLEAPDEPRGPAPGPAE